VNESGYGLRKIRCRFRFCRPFVLTLLLLFAVVATGCGEHNSNPELRESNLRLVAVLYSQYVSAHGGEAPRDADDFRVFVKSLGSGVLERVGLAGCDELLASPRDGKPFVIKYRDVDWKLDNVIAYEQQGVGRTRYIASDQGAVSEITEQQFQSRLKDEM
jgi:hypothetical protein